MRGLIVGTGKRLAEVVHRMATLLTSGSQKSRELQESKARLEEAQRVAHVGYWVWDLDSDRVTWSDETYRIYGSRLQAVVGFDIDLEPDKDAKNAAAMVDF
jgi:PAS domain-containing protein